MAKHPRQVKLGEDVGGEGEEDFGEPRLKEAIEGVAEAVVVELFRAHMGGDEARDGLASGVR